MQWRNIGMKRWLARQQWHRWFAWYPVRIGEDTVWLETVEKRIPFCNTIGMQGDLPTEYRRLGE
jgi:hypothetical protein